MRALPADSLEYLAETADGKVAFDAAGAIVGAGAGAAAVGFGAGAGFAAAVGGAAAGVAGAAEAGAAVAPAAHSVLRKSFHFAPLSVPAVCAALYLALHSFIVSAWAGEPPSAAAPRNEATPIAT